MRRISVIALVMSFLATTALASIGASTQVRGVQIELRLNKTMYRMGESVEIGLILTNPGVASADFQFSTGQMYDFIVFRNGQVVWQWSYGRAFTQAFTTLTLQPQETKVFNERWDQRDIHGLQVPPGDYEMIAEFTATGRLGVPSRQEGPRLRFRIGSGPGTMKTDFPLVMSRLAIVAGTAVGEVLVNGRPILRIRVAAGGFSAPARAEIVAIRLQRLLAQGFKPEELSVVPLGSEAAIRWRDQLVVTVDANHARLNNTTPRALAAEWSRALTHAFSAGR